MKKIKYIKKLYFLTAILIGFSCIVFLQMTKKMAVFEVREAVCLDKKTFAILIDDSLRSKLQKNDFIYYKGKKVLYDWRIDEHQDMFLMQVEKEICRKQTITISIFLEKKKFYKILIENWRKK